VATAFVFLPILILPLMIARRRGTASRISFIVCLGFVFAVTTAAIGGCGGGGSSSNPPPATHQVTSSGVVSLTVH
jgi:hypothetical protein